MWLLGIIAGLFAALGLEPKRGEVLPEEYPSEPPMTADVPTNEVGNLAWFNPFADDGYSAPEYEAPQMGLLPIQNPYSEFMMPDTTSDAPVYSSFPDPVEIALNAAADVKTAVFGTKYDAMINAAAAQHGVAPRTLYNLLKAESHFREDIITGKVTSRVGALGIAQFMPATAIEELGSVEAALNPALAIPGAARYLAKLIASTGSVVAGVAAYNWGIGNVKKKGLAKAPAETRQYVLLITGVSIG